MRNQAVPASSQEKFYDRTNTSPRTTAAIDLPTVVSAHKRPAVPIFSNCCSLRVALRECSLWPLPNAWDRREALSGLDQFQPTDDFEQLSDAGKYGRSI